MQLDMDEEELPNAMLDSYLSEAYNRTLSMENRWPFFETRWDAAKPDGVDYVTLPSDCDPAGLITVTDVDRGIRLTQVSSEQAEAWLSSVALTTTPIYYTLWGDQLLLWPNPSGVRTLKLRGYRLPADWQAGGASAEPDCDYRLHQLLAHYAIALAYAQQEDEVLEDVYMKRWQASFGAAHNAICSPRHNRPLVLNGGLPLDVSNAGRNVAWAPPVAP
jgi:hypothetical protein